MKASRNPRDDKGDKPEQQPQQRGSGEGSGSAMAAMVKKRREGENHADEAPRNEHDNTASKS
jgi:hypothetical protein